MNTTNLILSLEDEFNSIDEEFDTVESLDDSVDDGFQAMEDLSKVSAIAEEAISNSNGLSLESVQLVISSISSINTKLGSKTVEKGVTALESSINLVSDMSRSKIALESVKEKMQQIWKSIVDIFKWIAKMIARLIDKIISFFSNTDRTADGFEARIAKL